MSVIAPSDIELPAKVVDSGITPVPLSKQICIAWKNIDVKERLTIKKRVTNLYAKEKKSPKVILNDIHGFVNPGQMLALMGTRYVSAFYYFI